MFWTAQLPDDVLTSVFAPRPPTIHFISDGGTRPRHETTVTPAHFCSSDRGSPGVTACEFERLEAVATYL